MRNNHSEDHSGEGSLLLHKVWDSLGRCMRPNHSTKGSLCYRYYASDNGGPRLKERCHWVLAGDLEAIVITQLRKRLDAESGPTSFFQIETAPLSEQRRLVTDHIERIEIHADRVDISFTDVVGEPRLVSIAAPLIRRGKETQAGITAR